MQNTTKNILNIKVFSLLILCATLFCCAPHARAARLYFDTNGMTYGVGDTFLLPVMLDAEGQSINTISADISFPDAILSVKEARSTNSPITNWIDQPTVSGNTVTFSGMIPGGFDGIASAGTTERAPATLLVLVVHADASGSGEFKFIDAHTYLNDGEGTEAIRFASPITMTMSAKGTGAKLTESDTIAPEPFLPTITNTPLLYDGRFVVVFSTTDKGSGVAYYQVSEGYGDWITTTSPYLLTDQTLRSSVRVRAVDHAGNIRVSAVGTPINIPGYVFMIIILGIGVLLYIVYYRYNKKYST